MNILIIQINWGADLNSRFQSFCKSDYDQQEDEADTDDVVQSIVEEAVESIDDADKEPPMENA